MTATAVRIIRAGDCQTMPWKNGGGSTTQIATSPAGSSLESFHWRISMAQVASDGPFSDFPGIDRTLAVVQGNGMVLTVGDSAPVTVSRGGAPVRFPGDVPTSARLTNGAITDLNVMTRRGRLTHRVLRITKPASCDFSEGDDIAVMLSLHGTATVTSERGVETLDHGDAAVVYRTATAGFRISPSTSDCYLILLRGCCSR
jgi:environmental stress-induced protein Ves